MPRGTMEDEALQYPRQQLSPERLEGAREAIVFFQISLLLQLLG